MDRDASFESSVGPVEPLAGVHHPDPALFHLAGPTEVSSEDQPPDPPTSIVVHAPVGSSRNGGVKSSCGTKPSSGDSGVDYTPTSTPDLINLLFPPSPTDLPTFHPLDLVYNRADPDDLLHPGRMTDKRQIALKWFLKKWHGNTWMQDQDFWKECASLIASNLVADSTFLDISRVLYCSRKGLFCERPDPFCPRCALDLRIEPAQYEYAHVFDGAPFWYMAVAGSELDPAKAGLHFGPNNHRQHWRPFTGGRRGVGVTSWPEGLAQLEMLAGLPFEMCRTLVKWGIAGGAFCHLEPDVLFCPGFSPGCEWSTVDHAVLPHGNILFNTASIVDFETAKGLFNVYNFLFQSQKLSPAVYPDLLVARLQDDAAIKSWLGYALKPWPIAKWYRRGRRAGCDIADLNLIFDTIVYEHLVEMLSGIRSPRKYGNLNPKSGQNVYIGQRLPPPLKVEAIRRWVTEPAFAAEHPEWEASVDRYLQKREMRQGRRTDPELDHDAAGQ